uniref:NADH:ubiquinone reductase (H(+)-translocating) n=1 Tax=Neobenedenia melleni TaxID=280695 RepID=A0A096VGV9_9PLAT|nr:NADH dehydrogenase subunit 5 [Neobenedenia melleni]
MIINIILLCLFIFISFFNNVFSLSINNTAFNNIFLSLNYNFHSSFFLIMLFICGFISIIFSLHYFNWENNNLNLLVILFLSIMCFLVSVNDLYNCLIGWEYLGFVSFLLILYYSNYDTSRAANITLVSSRFGDVGLFVILGLFLNFLYYNNTLFFLVSLFFIIATKSAIFPFSSWLLEAMRAPTPVSCLVHSSTLVAAGIWFFINFYYILSTNFIFIILILEILTIIISSFSALILLDVKKLVALSTCNNVSWCFIYYILGNLELCLIQIISHGIAKCMLFCVMGDNLVVSGSSQLNSSLFNLHFINSINLIIPSLLIFFLSGLPYLGVFFSKHLLLSFNLLNTPYNIFIQILLYFCVFLTYCYSFRLYFLITNIYSGLSSGIVISYTLCSIFILLSTIYNFFLINSLEEFGYLDYNSCYLVLLIQILGFFVGNIMNNNINNEFGLNFFGQDLLIFFNNNIISIFNSFFLILSSFRLERFLNNISFNLNLFSVSLLNAISLMLFSLVLIFFYIFLF